MSPARRKPGARIAEQAKAWPDPAGVWLLDVNVLVALLDPRHSHHIRAHAWFAAAAGAWASCALTQNGALRIMSNPRYTNPMPSAIDAARLLARLCAAPEHRYWPCDLSLLNDSTVVSDRLLTHSQITDTYLLALAVKHGGRLATFDKRLVADAVRGGQAALHVIA